MAYSAYVETPEDLNPERTGSHASSPGGQRPLARNAEYTFVAGGDPQRAVHVSHY